MLLLTGFADLSIVGSAERERAPQLLTGELWQSMSQDAKVAFIWGIGNLVELERAQGGVQSPGSKSFIPFLVRGLKGKPINEVVHTIDAYYTAHPAEIKRPVVDAIFQAIVLPAVRAEKGRSGK
jgi:hypothetical protein